MVSSRIGVTGIPRAAGAVAAECAATVDTRPPARRSTPRETCRRRAIAVLATARFPRSFLTNRPIDPWADRSSSGFSVGYCMAANTAAMAPTISRVAAVSTSRNAVLAVRMAAERAGKMPATHTTVLV
jgi:hypothetical protein